MRQVGGMAPLIVLVVVTLVARGLGQFGIERLRTWADATRVGLAAMFWFTAAAHFLPMRKDLVAMVPPWVPAPEWMVTLTGIFEVLGGLGLLVRRTRRLAAIGLIALLVAVFPANVHAAQEDLTIGGSAATPLVPRIAMQALFVALVVWTGLRSSDARPLARARPAATSVVPPGPDAMR
jgi:uncharacterized membrane protein